MNQVIRDRNTVIELIFFKVYEEGGGYLRSNLSQFMPVGPVPSPLTFFTICLFQPESDFSPSVTNAGW